VERELKFLSAEPVAALLCLREALEPAVALLRSWKRAGS
jgi:hypothetical protein